MQITVRVKPGSKKGPLVEQNADGSLTIFIRERPVEGQANRAVIELIAEQFDVAKSNVEIVRGETSKIKVLNIHSPTK